MAFLKAVLLASFLAPATAWYRYAQMVTGDVVKEAGNLTMGGKVGTYTVLIQVLNTLAGDLKLLTECCGDARPLAQEITNKVNLNEKLSFIGLKQLDPLQMLGTCADKADTGVLYVFKNKFYNKDQRAVNISSFDYKLAMKKMREEEKKKKQEERAAMQEQRKYDREIAKAAKAAEAKIKEAEKEGKAKAEEVTEEVEKELAKLEGQEKRQGDQQNEEGQGEDRQDDSAEDVQKALTSAADKAEEAVEEAKKKAEAAKDDAVKAADQAVQKATKDAAATAKKAKKSAQAAAEKAEESVEKIQKRRLDGYLPIDFANRCNVGYCFINFRTSQARQHFNSMFDNVAAQSCLPGFNSYKEHASQ
eukprot:g16878.t1